MQRPRPISGHQAGYAATYPSAEGGGFIPQNYFPQNPNFPSPVQFNPQYPQQFLFQSQSQSQPFFQNTNPNFQNPNLHFPHQPPQQPHRHPPPQPSLKPNPHFPYQQQRPHRPPSPPKPSLNPKPTLERIEAAVSKAQRDISSAGENVTAWKVSKEALVSLQADSWGSLGIQELKDVPTLRRLLATVGKVTAFIHCFVTSQKIVSLHDLEVAICENEGLERFEELGLGPLSCHPLSKHYFAVPSDSKEVFKISTEEIIASLNVFMDTAHKKHFAAEEFLNFLAEQKFVPCKEKLGVRIKNFGLHLSYIREARKAEKTILSKTLEGVNSTDKSRNRTKSFSVECKDFVGKHARFDSSSDDYDTSSDDYDTDNDDNSSGGDAAGVGGGDAAGGITCSRHNDKGKVKYKSSCPYPSTSEDMVHLGLKVETGEKVFPSDNQIAYNEDRKSSSKKRKRKQSKIRTRRSKDDKSISSRSLMVKLREKNNNSSSSSKLLKKEQTINVDEKKLGHLILGSGDVEKFITTWREACGERSVPEVLDMMVNFYMTTSKERKKEKTRKIFSAYPGIGLLNIAVASVKCGLLDSVYDAVQAFGEHGCTNPGSAPSPEVIEIGSEDDFVVGTNEGIPESICNMSNNIELWLKTFRWKIWNDVQGILRLGITVDNIIENIARYFELGLDMPRERDLNSGKQFAALKRFHDCEIWLASQFSVKDFDSLGHGNFCRFLEEHASLLPNEIYSALNGKMSEPSCLVTMLQQQFGVLLYQAKSNMKDNCELSTSHISLLLRRQFPTIFFQIVGNEPEKCFLDISNRQKNGNSHCILYSATLFGKQLSGDLLVCSDKLLSEATQMNTEVGQLINSHGYISAKNAVECLLKVPMLSDLLSWSHWDLVYAPSLGPLPDLLLNEVETKELLCLATIDGKIIRIDHAATVDKFLEAMIQFSSFQVALQLLSLLSLYRGVSNAPLSLLKCYAQRGIDVIIRNSTDSPEECTGREILMHNYTRQRQITLDKGTINDASSFDPQGTSKASTLSESFCRTKKAVVAISRFILECLGYLPSEFRNFVSEILVSGLQSVAKDALLVILHECKEIHQRLMLHDIGLSLGIPEWIEDYHMFSSSILHKNSSLCLNSGESLNYPPGTSKKPSSNYHKTQVDIGPDASQTKEEDGLKSEVNIRRNNVAFANGHCQGDGTSEQQDSDEVSSVNSSISEDRVLKEANLIVESIRREEFGLDADLNYSESCLLKKQHARLGRALHCLSQELYSQDSHLLLELVQNADDNIYQKDVDPTLVFILQETGIIVLNNEQGFSSQNIRALCDIGNSTKKESVGYIGHKGIGFKSVFRVTDAPEIHSNGFHVKFDITEGQIGFVLPTLIPPCNIDMFRPLLYGGNDKKDDTKWSTCIVLPFRSNSRDENGMASIISMFSDLHPSLLLFLHRLRCIKFVSMLSATFVAMRREILDNGIIKVSHGQETMSWLVASKKLQASLIRPDIQSTEIAIAFTLQEGENGEYKPHLSQQPVFAYLPLRNYGMKFILQADFVLPSSREEVVGDSAWNQWLLSEFPSLFVSAEESFCVLPCFENNPGKAVTAYMSFVPLGGDVHGFFSHLPHLIISKLRTSNCLLLDGPDLTWVLPCKVLRGWDEQARMLLSDSLLQKHIGLGYLSKDIELSDALAKALSIQDYGPKVLIEVISSICCTVDGIESLGLDWLSSWLATLQSTMSTHTPGYLSSSTGFEYDLINALRKVPFIPLSDGSYSSVADGPIWLPCDASGIGIECKNGAKDFPSLYAKLRTVNPLLFTASTTATSSIAEGRGDCLIQMLYKVGVHKLSAHEVIRDHILTALSEEIYVDEEVLMIEYLAFVMIHCQEVCAQCLSEKEGIISELRKKRAVLTSHGFKCPVSEPIHFSNEYKNIVKIDMLIGKIDEKWLEVDAVYLNHPTTQSLSSGMLKWRTFFQQLGVTDFVQVTGIINQGELGGEASLIKDWESSELVNFLSTFSSKNYRGSCIYLLEVLDKMWDDYYSANSRSYITSKTEEVQISIVSSFMKSILEYRWIASSMDQELHRSKDLFYNCEEVHSILGDLAPYAVPKVNSRLLLKDIGFKTEVSLDDALEILQSWRLSETPFMASTVQMARFYSFLAERFTSSNVKIPEELISSSFIFVPFLGTSRHKDYTCGIFLSPKELYWHDPTGCVDKMKELIHLYASTVKTDSLPWKTLSAYYPNLHDFFINVCTVRELPPFGSYLQILLQLSSVSLPSQAAHEVFGVFLNWAEDIKTGLVKPEEIFDLKENLCKLENTVLPTLQDKWVSLHPSFGLICWSDDDELKHQFKHTDGISFLNFGELSEGEGEVLSVKIAAVLHDLGVPALSEVVTREAIYYGTEDNKEKVYVINWILKYAQRYLHKLYPDMNLKQLGFQKLCQLQVVVVDKLFYRNTLKGHESTSKKHFECSCLLQGHILYISRTSDFHSIFLELSRLFFNGSTDLHFANFLHMLTTMAESGSSYGQIEFFIINSQKVPELPDGVPVWCLSSSPGLSEVETRQPILASPMIIEQDPSTSQRRAGISPNWPPTDWKNAPDRGRDLANYHLTQESSQPTDAVTCSIQPNFFEVDEGWLVEEASTESVMADEQATTLVRSSNSIDVQINTPVFIERDILPYCQTNDDNRNHRTGRLGELVAYRYFNEKLGSGSVKWVNEEVETGLPYDLIIGMGEDEMEYIEVKATIVRRKRWFQITPREWNFAAEKGDKYSIAHVVLLDANRAGLTVLKNPLRLCQQNTLQLQLNLMPTEQASSRA